MRGYAPSAPRMSEEGMPLILGGLSLSTLAVVLFVYYGKKSKDDAVKRAAVAP